eukprot:TRINITY_DN819_c0_g1_i1.p1 TRINITY_DN819_c0_g1~~TRINITY_DN819_c0_g1_i1.p1  ORF type:complete len:439 (-),score=70.30 TRINITY_DN819_c0_g1_i1:128-1444(-)
MEADLDLAVVGMEPIGGDGGQQPMSWDQLPGGHNLQPPDVPVLQDQPGPPPLSAQTKTRPPPSNKGTRQCPRKGCLLKLILADVPEDGARLESPCGHWALRKVGPNEYKAVCTIAGCNGSIARGEGLKESSKCWRDHPCWKQPPLGDASPVCGSNASCVQYAPNGVLVPCGPAFVAECLAFAPANDPGEPQRKRQKLSLEESQDVCACFAREMQRLLELVATDQMTEAEAFRHVAEVWQQEQIGKNRGNRDTDQGVEVAAVARLLWACWDASSSALEADKPLESLLQFGCNTIEELQATKDTEAAELMMRDCRTLRDAVLVTDSCSERTGIRIADNLRRVLGAPAETGQANPCPPECATQETPAGQMSELATLLAELNINPMLEHHMEGVSTVEELVGLDEDSFSRVCQKMREVPEVGLKKNSERKLQRIRKVGKLKA